MLLPKYYINFPEDGANIAKGTLGPFDKNGVPMVDYNHRYGNAGIKNNGSDFGVHYTPVTISIYAFSLLEKISRIDGGCEQDLRLFSVLVDWMVENLVPISDDASVWLHDFSIPFSEGYRTPYPSGIAQGEGISLLLRAYQLRPDDKLLEAVKKAFGAFSIDIRDQGVMSIEGEFTWYEEWPSEPPSHVLNGFMFALIGIYDYMKFFDSDIALSMWQGGLRTLEHNIDKFDAGYCSRYDLLRGLVVSESYHLLHIKLLRVIYNLSGNEIFNDVATKWEGYLVNHSQLRRKFYALYDNLRHNSEYRACKVRQLCKKFRL